MVLPTTGRYMHVPFRSLLSQHLENLLVAGRAVGGGRKAHAATRNMGAAQ